MKKIYGYKTADSPDLFTTYTIRGFTLADSLEEAAKIFGVENPNGFNVVAELDREEFLKEYKDHAHGYWSQEHDRMVRAIERYEMIMTDLRMIAIDLGYSPGFDI
jgi:hypothetical protein